jgi:dolichol-phosphate mannosyltransferase
LSKVVIILPTFNESEIIESTIQEVLKIINTLKNFDLQILVVDSLSPDGTHEIVKRIAAENPKVNLLIVEERGLGLALVKGYEYAFKNLNADIVLQMDADLQHDPHDIPKLLEPFARGAEFVQGSRFIKGGGNNLEPHRRFLSWAANWSARILFGALKTHEFTTSFRAFTKKVYEGIDFHQVPHRGKSFIFQPAFLYAALKNKVNIVEVPIVFTDRRKGYSKMDMFQYSTSLLKYGLRCRVKKHAKFFKFCIVGTSGALMQSVIYGIFKSIIHPSIAIAIGAELAIINGYIWNNKWTFGDRKIQGNHLKKFPQYNIGSLGSLLIQAVTVGAGTFVFGRSQLVDWFFACLGIGIGLIWNFLFYSKVVWKKR